MKTRSFCWCFLDRFGVLLYNGGLIKIVDCMEYDELSLDAFYVKAQTNTDPKDLQNTIKLQDLIDIRRQTKKESAGR